jgi:DNA-binding response OmpR family regulator
MAQRKALIIADLQGAGGLLSMILRKEGYDVEVIGTFGPTAFTKAVKALSEKKYDLVVPTNNGMSSNELLAIIPEIRVCDPNVKIIAMSGHHPPDFVRQLWEKGIDDFMPMPFPLEEFLARVKRCFPE